MAMMTSLLDSNSARRVNFLNFEIKISCMGPNLVNGAAVDSPIRVEERGVSQCGVKVEEHIFLYQTGQFFLLLTIESAH